LINQPNISV